ncbi:amidase family protein [Streptomyces sp. NPDC058655]|uniref:amidase family protein n=1 Tax=Streptomyces sp. NPDC058655 TaxID=3346577 RepID=UPI003658C1FE
MTPPTPSPTSPPSPPPATRPPRPERRGWPGPPHWATPTPTPTSRRPPFALCTGSSTPGSANSSTQVELRDPGPAWTALRAGTPDSDTESLLQSNTRILRKAFEDADLLATPTTSHPPHGHDGPGTHMSVALTWAANLSSHPAITLPAGRTRNGEPVGLQLIARHHADGMLLSAAATFTQDTAGSGRVGRWGGPGCWCS